MKNNPNCFKGEFGQIRIEKKKSLEHHDLKHGFILTLFLRVFFVLNVCIYLNAFHTSKHYKP